MFRNFELISLVAYAKESQELLASAQLYCLIQSTEGPRLTRILGLGKNRVT